MCDWIKQTNCWGHSCRDVDICSSAPYYFNVIDINKENRKLPPISDSSSWTLPRRKWRCDITCSWLLCPLILMCILHTDLHCLGIWRFKSPGSSGLAIRGFNMCVFVWYWKISRLVFLWTWWIYWNDNQYCLFINTLNFSHYKPPDSRMISI